eukprot:Rhum_TRINITY_DN10385_c1_g1::Rhum_TRINITY_DN10385_c1_g1_i1::g.38224::m.38224
MSPAYPLRCRLRRATAAMFATAALTLFVWVSLSFTVLRSEGAAAPTATATSAQVRRPTPRPLPPPRPRPSPQLTSRRPKSPLPKPSSPSLSPSPSPSPKPSSQQPQTSLVDCIDVEATAPSQSSLDAAAPNAGRSVAELVHQMDAAAASASAPPVRVLTYQACHGALSQHYGHLSALVVAKYIGADVVVLPHARTRETFASRNVLGAKREERTDGTKANAWWEIPLTMIYNTSSFEDYLRRPFEPLDRYAGPEAAADTRRAKQARVVNYPAPPGPVTLPNSFRGYDTHFHTGVKKALGFEGREDVRVVGIRYKRRRLGRMWAQIVDRQVESMTREAGVSVVVVDLGCTDIMVGSNLAKNATTEDVLELGAANRQLQLAGYLTEAARGASEALHRRHPGGWTGLHLRIERDMFTDNSAKRWTRAYRRAQASFLDQNRQPLLIASGVFEYLEPGSTELAELLGPYTERHALHRVCVSGASKLPNDVRPWIDYLVLKEGARFQGHEYSVLSWLVVQQRTLEGRPLDTSSLIRKKTLRESHAECCEGDRCLVWVCRETEGAPEVDVMRYLAYDDDVKPPAVLNPKSGVLIP